MTTYREDDMRRRGAFYWIYIYEYFPVTTYENIVNQSICRYIFTSIPQILLFHGCLLGKGFSLSFVVSYFSITWPMNDSGATVFVANSHSFFITAVSWKTSSVLDHPARACLDFHPWWMKCNAAILLLCMLRFPDARFLLFFFLMALLYISHYLEIFTSLAKTIL